MRSTRFSRLCNGENSCTSAYTNCPVPDPIDSIFRLLLCCCVACFRSHQSQRQRHPSSSSSSTNQLLGCIMCNPFHHQPLTTAAAATARQGRNDPCSGGTCARRWGPRQNCAACFSMCTGQSVHKSAPTDFILFTILTRTPDHGFNHGFKCTVPSHTPPPPVTAGTHYNEGHLVADAQGYAMFSTVGEVICDGSSKRCISPTVSRTMW